MSLPGHIVSSWNCWTVVFVCSLGGGLMKDDMDSVRKMAENGSVWSLFVWMSVRLRA